MFRLLILLPILLLAIGCAGNSGNATAADAAPPRNPTEMLQVGDIAPDFAVPDHNGNMVRLADFRGQRNVVLIFYPANETPGCTRQLCAARDSFDQYQAADAVVLGVNHASQESHRSFVNNHDFQFPLLADTEREMIRNYGSLSGTGGIARTVYVIGKDGRIQYAERGLPETGTILAAIRS